VVFPQDIGLTVVNRSYLPGQTQCPPSWDSVVIDGRQLGPVVRVSGSANSTLKGFTIQNGLYDAFGGGVLCTAGAILDNRVQYNSADWGGGGIYCYAYGDVIQVCDNLVEYNTSPAGAGGGLLVHGRPPVEIRRNVIRYNTAWTNGGGIRFSYIQPGEPFLEQDASITDNLVAGNHVTGPDPRGGGIYALDWPQTARRNVVTDNDVVAKGVYFYRLESPGFTDTKKAVVMR
jgi:hypothetical protein